MDMVLTDIAIQFIAVSGFFCIGGLLYWILERVYNRLNLGREDRRKRFNKIMKKESERQADFEKMQADWNKKFQKN